MSGFRFIGRRAEQQQLRDYLRKALNGHGQTVFVRGDPGSGKSALIREFARRCQAHLAELVIATGNCNAQVGQGDPYLPFREILSLLTGDVDGRLAPSTLTAENADRLRAMMGRSVQILVETGPDLVDALVPGYKLMAVLGRAVVNKSGWGDGLERLSRRRSPPAGTVALEQGHILQQCTDFLLHLAAQQPLIIVVDDLHWADQGSINLFFHLARRIENSRILLVGCYRPAEVALGRDGERHPLEPVVNELQRYFGQMTVDLDRAIRREGQAFVDGIIDSIPNRFPPCFRISLFNQTGGHPLFTVELIHAMQERGDLVQDALGQWGMRGTLDWSTLPARVEGVIEERIGRLDESSRRLLSVASVEGMEFTAQVVAHLLELPERTVLQTLSRHLDRRHQLVRPRDERRVGERVLSRYEFAHGLFQQYLYESLTPREAELLHGEIVEVLEAFYTGITHTIAVRLAHHCERAGDLARASQYHCLAGDGATRVHAYAEARRHYQLALDALARLPDTIENQMARIDVTFKFERVSFYAEDLTDSMARLRAVESLAERLLAGEETDPANRLRLARVHYLMGRTHHYLNELPAALAYYQKVLEAAEEAGDEELLAIPAGVIGRVLTTQGHFPRAEALLRRAVPPLAQTANWHEWVFAMGYLGVTLAAQGKYDEGLTHGQRALARALRVRDPTLIAANYCMLAFVHFFGEETVRMMEASQAAVETARPARSDLDLYSGYGTLAWAQSRLGLHAAADASMDRSLSAGEQLGGRLVLSDLFAVARAEMALNAGRLDEAQRLAEAAIQQARAVGGPYAEGLAEWIIARVLLLRYPPDREGAGLRVAASLEALTASGARADIERIRARWLSGATPSLHRPVAPRLATAF